MTDGTVPEPVTFLHIHLRKSQWEKSGRGAASSKISLAVQFSDVALKLLHMKMLPGSKVSCQAVTYKLVDAFSSPVVSKVACTPNSTTLRSKSVGSLSLFNFLALQVTNRLAFKLKKM